MVGSAAVMAVSNPMNKKVLRDMQFLCLPLLLFCAFSFYWQQRHKDSGIALRSTKFIVNADGEFGYRPMLYFGFWVGYTGRKPVWWSSKTPYCIIKDFKFFDRNGQLLQAVPFRQNNQKYGYLRKSGSHYFPSEDKYHSSVSMTLPFNSKVNKGRVQATLQIVDSDKNPTKIYAETKIDMIANVDCNYEGC